MKKIFILFSIFVLLFTASCEKSSEEYSSSVSYNDIPIETEPSKPDTLKIGYSEFTGKFDPFYAVYSEDKDVVNVTSVSLVTINNSGEVINSANKGEIDFVNGKEYLFSGIANLDVARNTAGNEIITITLNNDVRFSDGHVLNIDDVIFSMYVLSDPTYNGPSLFNTLPIEGMKEYRIEGSNYISGIERISDVSLKVHLDGVDNDIYSKLSIVVAPLHYYGSEELYNFDDCKFGFEKGNLDFLNEKSSRPLGAGPYSFVSYEDGVVKFKRNEYYFNGTPKTKFLEFIEVSESEKIKKLVSEDIHITRSNITSDTIKYISEINGGNDGSRINILNLDINGYSYIGISADNVAVSNDKGSEASKNLRKAFATLFSVYKYDAVNNYFGKDYTIEYPISRSSWAYPDNEVSAYSTNHKDEYIYSENMSVTDKYDTALRTAKEYLIEAGYKFDEVNGKFISAPDGAKLEYDIVILNNKNYTHPAHGILSDVKYALSTIGIKLNIIDYTDSEEFWNIVYGTDCMMWVAGIEYPTQEPILRQNYYSDENKFGISDVELDLIIEEYMDISNKDIKALKINECFSILRDWAVEVPLYESSESLLINSSVVYDETLDNGMFNYNFTDLLPVIELK